MEIAIAAKIVFDSQDVVVGENGDFDFSRAKPVISEYDLPAIEAAVRIAEAVPGSKTSVVSVGADCIDDAKLKKGILARGVDELSMGADEAFANLDAHASADALARLIEARGDVDLVVCGDGSADEYAQQVDVQLAERLGLPIVTAVCELVVEDGTVRATRCLEDCDELVEVRLPAVVSVTPAVAVARIPGMRDILAAGKKPMDVSGAEEAPQRTVETVRLAPPEKMQRRQEIIDAAEEGSIEKLVAAVKAAL